MAAVCCLSLAVAMSAFAQSDEPYEGPTILTRDSNTAGQHGGQLLDFRLWGDITGVMDDGLTAPTLTSSGEVNTQGPLYGGEAGFGASGTRTWEFDQISLDYKGSWRQYTVNNLFNGTSQFLDLEWQHRLARHLQLIVHETGGISSLSFGTMSYYPLANSALLGVPLNELFDNTAYFSQSTLELVWQKTARLSFGFGGDDFMVDRKSPLLVNSSGYRGRADAAYRLSARQTASLSYAYEYFEYPRAYGYSRINQLEAGWAVGLGPRTEFAVAGGAAQTDTLGLVEVQLDPVIAAILGESYTITTSKRDVIIPVGEARWTRRFATSAIGLNAAMSVTPGNGVYLTSRGMNGAVTYSYAGSRRLTFATTAGYSRMTAAGQQTIAPYGGFYGGAGATWRLFTDAHMEARYDYRRYNIRDVASKNENRVSLGLAISTGERPLAIW